MLLPPHRIETPPSFSASFDGMPVDRVIKTEVGQVLEGDYQIPVMRQYEAEGPKNHNTTYDATTTRIMPAVNNTEPPEMTLRPSWGSRPINVKQEERGEVRQRHQNVLSRPALHKPVSVREASPKPVRIKPVISPKEEIPLALEEPSPIPEASVAVPITLTMRFAAFALEAGVGCFIGVFLVWACMTWCSDKFKSSLHENFARQYGVFGKHPPNLGPALGSTSISSLLSPVNLLLPAVLSYIFAFGSPGTRILGYKLVNAQDFKEISVWKAWMFQLLCTLIWSYPGVGGTILVLSCFFIKHRRNLLEKSFGVVYACRLKGYKQD